jgi:hypothetical protein
MINPRSYIKLDRDEIFEPLYNSPMLLSTNTLLWRTYDKRYSTNPDRYGCYSLNTIDNKYVKQPNREIGCFATNGYLKIIDLRFMKSLLSRIIQMKRNDEFIADFASVIISFGLCSLRHQITLVKHLFHDLLETNTAESKQIKRGINNMISEWSHNTLIEHEGIRIAEPINDGRTMAFLQELFRGHFDGFLSPYLKTPFHVEKGCILYPELILFSQKNCDLVDLDSYPSIVDKRSLIDFIGDRRELLDDGMTVNYSKISMKDFMYGDTKNQNKDCLPHYLDAIEDGLNRDDNSVLAQYKKGVKAGERWRNKICITTPYAPHPCFPVSPFTSRTLSKDIDHSPYHIE